MDNAHPSMANSGWRLLTGYTLAATGSWIDLLAILTLAAYHFKASSNEMAVVSVCILFPAIALSRFIGKWCDSGAAARILALGMSVRAAITISLIFSDNLVLFTGLVLLRSVATSFIAPAENVVSKSFIAAEDIPRYFGYLGTVNNLAKILAPALGGALSAVYGEKNCLVLGVFLTLLGILFTLSVTRLKSLERIHKGPASVAALNSEGTGALRWVLGTVAIYFFLVFVINNQLPLLLERAGFGKELLGLLISCSGVGGCLTGIFLARRKEDVGRRARPTLLLVLGAFTASCFIFMGLALLGPIEVSEYLLALLFFCTGIAGTAFAVSLNSMVVQRFAESVGRASAMIQSTQSVAMLIAPVCGALLMTRLNVSGLFIVDGAVCLLVFFVLFVLNRSIAARPR